MRAFIALLIIRMAATISKINQRRLNKKSTLICSPIDKKNKDKKNTLKGIKCASNQFIEFDWEIRTPAIKAPIAGDKLIKWVAHANPKQNSKPRNTCNSWSLFNDAGNGN